MDLPSIKQQWEREGFCVFPDFIDDKRLNSLQLSCDNILNQWIGNTSNPERALAYVGNMAYLTDLQYFKNNPIGFMDLLELIAEPRILEILNFLAGDKAWFHNTQYFFNPLYKSWPGNWHRDTQFLATDPAIERERMHQGTGVHFRIAFCHDNCLEYVPGSEQRWDTPEEYAIRKGNAANSEAMPGKKRISLNRGDALLFNAWGIHRGIYDMKTPRRTFDIIYMLGEPCHYFPPPATCFQNSDILDKLSARSQNFFNDFIRTYQSHWDGSKSN